MYSAGSELRISVNNLPELNELLNDARRDMEQLSRTIAKLSCFDLVVSFETTQIDQAGAIEAASSTMRDIPTK